MAANTDNTIPATPDVDVDKLADPDTVKRTTVPVAGVSPGWQRGEGDLLPGEPGAPPINRGAGQYRDPDLADHEAPFASPPPPDPGVPAGMSVLPGSKDTLPVAPGTIIPSDKAGEPGPVGNTTAKAGS